MAQNVVAGNGKQRLLTRTQYQARVYEAETLWQLQRLIWADFGLSHVPTRRDNDLVAANFQDVDVAVISPAIIWPETIPPRFSKGEASPTDDVTFHRFLKTIEGRNTWLRTYRAHFYSDDGHSFTYMMLSASPLQKERPTKDLSKLRIWIQSGVHGNEPAGDQAVLALLGRMDQDPEWTNEILDGVDILVFPRCNPEGIISYNRPTNFGVDLNRDHIKLEVPQSAHIRKIFSEFGPHIAIDMHEYTAKARYGKYCHGSDVMFSAAKNLNVHPNIRDISEELFASTIGQRLSTAGFRHGPYTPTIGGSVTFKESGSDGKIGRNAMGLTQCISFLCETRGIGIADQHFQRRTAGGLTFLQSVLEITAENHDFIYSTVENSIKSFIGGTDDIVVKDTPTTVDRTFTMIDTKTGRLEHLPIQFTSSTPLTATLIRARPEAYVIPAFMHEIVRRLVDLGLEVEQVQHDCSADVEVLTIASVKLGRTYYEGIVPMAVTTVRDRRSVKLLAGTYFLSTRQKNAALAFIALEPENIDSYVSMNFIKMVAGDEYPVYRLMTSIQTY